MREAVHVRTLRPAAAAVKNRIRLTIFPIPRIAFTIRRASGAQWKLMMTTRVSGAAVSQSRMPSQKVRPRICLNVARVSSQPTR